MRRARSAVSDSFTAVLLMVRVIAFLVCILTPGKMASLLMNFLWFSFKPTLVLLIADVFHPVDNFSIELFLNGDVRHGGGWGGAGPVLFTGGETGDVTGGDFLKLPSLLLGPNATGGGRCGFVQGHGVACRLRSLV